MTRNGSDSPHTWGRFVPRGFLHSTTSHLKFNQLWDSSIFQFNILLPAYRLLDSLNLTVWIIEVYFHQVFPQSWPQQMFWVPKMTYTWFRDPQGLLIRLRPITCTHLAKLRGVICATSRIKKAIDSQLFRKAKESCITIVLGWMIAFGEKDIVLILATFS